jgi:hypothetical protein
MSKGQATERIRLQIGFHRMFFDKDVSKKLTAKLMNETHGIQFKTKRLTAIYTIHSTVTFNIQLIHKTFNRKTQQNIELKYTVTSLKGHSHEKRFLRLFH